MEFRIENITPTKASEYLETSPYNRLTVSTKRVVKNYASAMIRGEWSLNGESIVFDKEGRLLDGHHRMAAVVEAGIPITFSVCRGVDREAFTTYNCGLRTNVGQILSMKEVKNSTLIASMIGINFNLVNSGKIYANNGIGPSGSATRTVTDDYNTYMNDRDGYDNIASTAQRLKSYANMMKNSWIGGMIYFLTHTGGYSMDYVLAFFEALCKIDTSEISSADALKKFIIRNKMSNMNVENSYMFALLVKAWNAYVMNKQVKRITFNPEVEAYPKLILNHK